MCGRVGAHSNIFSEHQRRQCGCMVTAVSLGTLSIATFQFVSTAFQVNSIQKSLHGS